MIMKAQLENILAELDAIDTIEIQLIKAWSYAEKDFINFVIYSSAVCYIGTDSFWNMGHIWQSARLFPAERVETWSWLPW